MTVRADDPALHDLIAPGAGFECLAGGFTFTEGPVWDASRGCLFFTDIPERTIWQLQAVTGEVSPWRRDTNMANGLALDGAGGLIACEAATSVLSRYGADGTRTVIATEWQGKELNSPNDVIVAPDGSIYFTDPHYGREGPPHGVARPRYLDFQGVFRVVPGARGGPGEEEIVEPQLVAGDFNTPNGLALSPDGSLLYVVDSVRMHVRVFERRPDGSLAGGRVFLAQQEEELDLVAVLAYIHEHGGPPHGIPDGMKVDERGNVWVTGPGGIWVIGPDGRQLGLLETPELPANLAFGGSDGRMLYVCATHSLYGIPTLVRGA